MDKKVIEKIKKILLASKKQLHEDLKSFTEKDEHTKDEHHAKFPDYGDKSDESVQEIDEYTTNLATEKVLESALRDIDNALARIAKGNYGICKYCKQKIGQKRLMARPVANTCIACKIKLQKMA
ncbi:TraR/DksA family transcriptional regulator [Patescibacteria group bacterium]|nr:TraR/DksA family transcriptional regulator [Patescibacteria group bacterium]MBU1663131.1 TraR/DksA family transcriptional regulator [Patescibacteria group bacterium]MBU1933673.1 TraR/DksA family transcriptional regulator [Patescibacteria group bacterium]MBU2008116.1 TraR/DksA family transcriptional regulator [Patescibacteria group bacterium]MBU2233461.1 TraR/DksA family transcriptional regulator [Patescibacteria group bacterium]